MTNDDALIEQLAHICDTHDHVQGRITDGRYAGRSVFVHALKFLGWNDAAIMKEVTARWPDPRLTPLTTEDLRILETPQSISHTRSITAAFPFRVLLYEGEWMDLLPVNVWMNDDGFWMVEHTQSLFADTKDIHIVAYELTVMGRPIHVDFHHSILAGTTFTFWEDGELLSTAS